MSVQRPPAGVGLTALGVARVRAAETARPDRLFDDPFAAAFDAATPDAFPETRAPDDEQRSIGAAFALHAAIRTRYYDDVLLAATRQDVRQVVLVAAGLDTRAYRLPWPDGVTVSEVDLPEVFAFKDSVLGDAVRCARHAVATDLRDDWALPGHDPAAPTAWLAEGLLIYLIHDEAAALLTKVGELSAPGSRIAFEYSTGTPSDLVRRATAGRTMSSYSDLWRGGLREDSADWLRDHGWRPEVDRLHDVAARHGRPPRSPSRSGFVSATR